VFHAISFLVPDPPSSFFLWPFLGELTRLLSPPRKNSVVFPLWPTRRGSPLAVLGAPLRPPHLFSVFPYTPVRSTALEGLTSTSRAFVLSLSRPLVQACIPLFDTLPLPSSRPSPKPSVGAFGSSSTPPACPCRHVLPGAETPRPLECERHIPHCFHSCTLSASGVDQRPLRFFHPPSLISSPTTSS